MTNSIPEEAPNWAVRLEAKVDVALTRHSAAIEGLNEQLVSHVADSDKAIGHFDREIDRLDTRLKAQETANYVTPRALITAIASTIAIAAGFVALIDRITGVS